MKLKVVIDNQTYDVEVKDIHARPVIAVVEGERYEVWLEIDEPQASHSSAVPSVSLPDSPQPTSASKLEPNTGGAKDVTSPLPGVIVAVLVKPGDEISRGQELCTLEAMKMKNAIRANREGTIAAVEVNVGDQVGHGQVLMTYTD